VRQRTSIAQEVASPLVLIKTNEYSDSYVFQIKCAHSCCPVSGARRMRLKHDARAETLFLDRYLSRRAPALQNLAIAQNRQGQDINLTFSGPCSRRCLCVTCAAAAEGLAGSERSSLEPSGLFGN